MEWLVSILAVDGPIHLSIESDLIDFQAWVNLYRDDCDVDASLSFLLQSLWYSTCNQSLVYLHSKLPLLSSLVSWIGIPLHHRVTCSHSQWTVYSWQRYPRHKAWFKWTPLTLCHPLRRSIEVLVLSLCSCSDLIFPSWFILWVPYFSNEVSSLDQVTTEV